LFYSELTFLFVLILIVHPADRLETPILLMWDFKNSKIYVKLFLCVKTKGVTSKLPSASRRR